MANYLRPDVYVEELNTGEKPIASVSTSVGAFVGVTTRGKVGQPVLVTSWTDFIKKFAKGLATPFMRSSDLAYAVYGFYQNGGSNCYIVRVPSTTMAKASVNVGVDELIITALDEGDWANDNLQVEIKALDDLFTVNVHFNGAIVETFEVANDLEHPQFFGEIINSKSEYIQIAPDQTLKVVPLTAFTGGSYDVSAITDADFTGEKGLVSLDLVHSVNLVAVPGKTSDTVTKALVDYATGRSDCFAIVDAPLNDETIAEDLITFREKLKGNGAVYHPWGKVSDPLSANGSLRKCPPCGHVMGVYARTDASRGVHKEPAGEEAVVKGFVDVVARVMPSHLDKLNPKSVNCIVAKPNSGIVIWGARNVGAEARKPYVSDIRYDLMIKKSLYEGTQWAVFEPIDELLLDRLGTSLASFLDLQWRNGSLKGASSEEAYYVKCDTELNDETAQNNGQLIAEVGYAKKKPAEFVVIRLVQKSNQ